MGIERCSPTSPVQTSIRVRCRPAEGRISTVKCKRGSKQAVGSWHAGDGLHCACCKMHGVQYKTDYYAANRLPSWLPRLEIER